MRFKIPKFPAGDYFKQRREEYLDGKYKPSWKYVNITKGKVASFLEKNRLAIPTKL